jgi:hypothetical protein
MKIPPTQLRLDDFLSKGVKQVQTITTDGSVHFNFEYELKGHTHRLDWVARQEEVLLASSDPKESTALIKRLHADVTAWFDEANAYG